MKLLRATKDLNVIPENGENRKYSVDYPLYEEEYKIGIRNIFRQVIEKKMEEHTGTNHKSERIFVNERKNIYAFIGKRGEGKTTAMDEFCRILRDMDREDWRSQVEWTEKTLDLEEIKKFGGIKLKFRVLDPIDASLLEREENLFELIMASLYRQYEKQILEKDKNGGWGDNQSRFVIERFQEIFRLYFTMSKKDKGGFRDQLLIWYNLCLEAR